MAKQSKDKDLNGLMLQAQAARELGISRAGVSYLITQGELRAVEMFGRKVVSRADVEAYKTKRQAKVKQTIKKKVTKK